MRLARFALLLAGLLPATAHAQRVVVLEIDGDHGHKLRDQVEHALKKAGTVDVIGIKKYRDGAARKHLKGLKAMTPAAVAQVSRVVPFEAAVGGTLSDTFFVRILDSSGEELWTKDLPVRGGMLSPDNARRLAKAITKAAQTASPAPAPSGEDAVAAATPSTPEVSSDDTPTIKGADRSPAVGGGMGIDVTADERRDDTSEAHTETTVVERDRDTDLEAEAHRKGPRAAPKLVQVQLAGTTTWRAYCSRPGVSSCGAYDKIVANNGTPPAGDTVDFSPQVPYAGVDVIADVFPLQSLDNAAKGIGLEGSYARGFSLTNVQVNNVGGGQSTKQVVSIDQAYYAMALYQYMFQPFAPEKRDPLLAHVGARLGWMARIFEVDPSAQVPLPGSHRGYWAAGLDGACPLGTSLVRFEGQILYYINPVAGPDEIVGYGKTASGSGFGFQAGLAGTIWGPFGYVLHFSYSTYHDTFYGQGNKWASGGAAQETYSGLYWGATAQF